MRGRRLRREGGPVSGRGAICGHPGFSSDEAMGFDLSRLTHAIAWSGRGVTLSLFVVFPARGDGTSPGRPVSTQPRGAQTYRLGLFGQSLSVVVFENNGARLIISAENPSRISEQLGLVTLAHQCKL